ncbi:AlbA family DNA-binding domain-containing protein [Agromyces mediolanus]|uniref:AlbA family DNA-binding domain-containing protein n=1 Tax=Agromyces mediolanus TaxID=41986 RepID=UPI001E56D2B2|nr:ATP-binding protein [Agromyces mediolanus]MCD1569901.1 ATP-binding protein [Agromyces mediolanus]
MAGTKQATIEPADCVRVSRYSERMWSPVNEGQIVAAIEAGDLVESHHLEIKRDAPASKAERSEIARDLASMALEGGSFLFGVEELKDAQAFRLAPMELPGRVEALEQIAELRIDPPLNIRVREIPSTVDASKGYLHVLVEASPQAPHMVDGVYYGRGERRRRRLGDAEVLRLHKHRAEDGERVRMMLEDDIAADPVPVNDRRLGHLFVVALPVAASPTLTESWVWDQTALLEVFRSSSRGLPREVAEWAPQPSSAHQLVARSHGQAWTSLESSLSYEAGAVDVEFCEDGSVHVFVGRLTDQPGRGRNAEQHMIMDGIAVAYVMRTMNWALSVAERSGYTGSWHLAVAGTGLEGVVAFSNTQSILMYDGTAYPAAVYKSSTQATRIEMQEKPGMVAGRLLNRFVRSLKLGAHYGSLLGWDR